MRELILKVFGKDVSHKPNWGFAKIPQPAKKEKAKMELNFASYEQMFVMSRRCVCVYMLRIYLAAVNTLIEKNITFCIFSSSSKPVVAKERKEVFLEEIEVSDFFIE